MSKEFNYKRAWKEYVKPEFEKLSTQIHEALVATLAEVEKIEQIGASMQVTGQSSDLMSKFDEIPTGELAWAHEVVYYYGHLASKGECQTAGLYWKFQNLANMSLINRKPYDGEVMIQAKNKIDKALEAFHDHKENTEYSDDEVTDYILGVSPKIGEDVLKLLKVDHVNHKPDVFCIGPQHFPKDGGMYIKPEQAPCCNCHQPYSEHTSDRVMFVQPDVKDNKDPKDFLKNNEEVIKRVLKNIVDLCTTAKIKLDGFAFVHP